MKKNIIALLVLMAGLAAQEAAAIGFITKPIKLNNALRSNSYEEKMYLVNTEKRQAEAALEATGQIKDWVKFYKLEDASTSIARIDIATSTSIFFKARFNIPATAANGTYKGTIKAVIKYKDDPQNTESKANVAQSMERPVEIAVSDKEIIQFSASVIPDTYDPALNSSLKIRLLFDNKSNVAIAPETRVKIKQGDNVKFTLNFPYPENIDTVKPGEIKEAPAITVPLALDPRVKYTAVLDFAQNGQVYFSKDFYFNYGYDNVKVLGAEYKWMPFGLNPVWMIAGLLLVLAAAVGFWFYLVRRKKIDTH